MAKLLRSIIFFGFLTSVMAASVLSQSGMLEIEASRDNTIFGEDTSLSNGNGQYLFTGATNNLAGRRALIYFDLNGQIPTGAVIDSVHLTLKLNKGQIIDPLEYNLHRLNTTWGEAGSDASADEGTGADAQPGDATWSHGNFSTDPWDTPGGDFQSAASASVLISGNNGAVTWSGMGLKADLEGWIQHDTTNHGWILLGNESLKKSAKRFMSREHDSEAERPRLTVYYTPVTSAKQLITDENKSLFVFPNPFRHDLNISYSLDQGAETQLAVYNLLGQQVRVLTEGFQPSGFHGHHWNGKDRSGKSLPTGIYYVILVAGDEKQVQKIMKTR